MQKIISLIVSAAVASAIQVTDGSKKKAAPKARDILACMIGAALTNTANGLGEMPGDWEIPPVCQEDTFSNFQYGDCANFELRGYPFDYDDGAWIRDDTTGCRACDGCPEYGSCVDTDPCYGLVGSLFPDNPDFYQTCEALEAAYEFPGGEDCNGEFCNASEFCNYDAEGARCESCSAFTYPEEDCRLDGLPEAGEAACLERCSEDARKAARNLREGRAH